MFSRGPSPQVLCHKIFQNLEVGRVVFSQICNFPSPPKFSSFKVWNVLYSFTPSTPSSHIWQCNKWIYLTLHTSEICLSSVSWNYSGPKYVTCLQLSLTTIFFSGGCPPPRNFGSVLRTLFSAGLLPINAFCP